MIVEEYKMRPLQMGVVMTDNAAENVKAFNMSEFSCEESEPEPDSVLDEEESDNDEVYWTDVNCIEEEEMFFAVQSGVDTNDPTPEGADAGRSEETLDEIVADFYDWSKSKLFRLGCTAHALQLVVRECISKNPKATEIMKYVSRLIGFFNSSTYWNRKLQELTGKGLIKIGDTRWNAFLLALQRILEDGFISSINEILEEVKLGKSGRKLLQTPDLISPEMEKDMTELASVLEPFLELTNALQSDEVTSSRVIPGLIGLYKEVSSKVCEQPYIRTLRSSLCLTLVERFGSSEEFNPRTRGSRKHLLKVFANKAYLLATILDPRVKLKPFSVPLPEPYKLDSYVPSEADVKKVLIDAYEESKIASGDHGENTEELYEAQPSKKKRSDDVVFFWPEEDTEAKESTENEIERYLSEERLSRDSSPLVYWKKQAKKYPILSKLARIYLGFPASSGAVERLFSISGSICRARRARIAIATIAAMLFYREARMSQWV